MKSCKFYNWCNENRSIVSNNKKFIIRNHWYTGHQFIIFIGVDFNGARRKEFRFGLFNFSVNIVVKKDR